MPHDKNDSVLKPGDVVIMEFVVKDVHGYEDYCNVSLESVEPLHPGSHKTTLSAVNTRQVYKK